jgi:hypothetical protein
MDAASFVQAALRGSATVRETWCCCTSRRGLDYGGEIIVEPLGPRTTPKVGVNLGMNELIV